MKKDIVINESNFKKFSKRLLKEINSLENKNINLSKSKNILSRVFTRQDYHEIRKELGGETLNDSSILLNNPEEAFPIAPQEFLKSFMLDESCNMFILMVKNGDMFLNSHYFKDDHRDNIIPLGAYRLENQNIRELNEAQIKGVLNYINGTSDNKELSFNSVKDMFYLNSEGVISKDLLALNPFVREVTKYQKIYAESKFNKEENNYTLILSKTENYCFDRMLLSIA